MATVIFIASWISNILRYTVNRAKMIFTTLETQEGYDFKLN